MIFEILVHCGHLQHAGKSPSDSMDRLLRNDGQLGPVSEVVFA